LNKPKREIFLFVVVGRSRSRGTNGREEKGRKGKRGREKKERERGEEKRSQQPKKTSDDIKKKAKRNDSERTREKK
jgi:hypothetical protein